MTKIAEIVLDHPPLNTLALALRSRVARELAAAFDDPSVEAVILRGAGGTFCAGAEIREFGTSDAVAHPDIADLAADIDRADKPVLALIEGVALGGGLELALGCHYRMATPDARLGLPEVKLGLLPGAGGTQRLPRLVGAQAAIEIMTSGAMTPAARAAAMGLVDGIAEGDALASARSFLAGALAQRRPLPRARDGVVALPPDTEPETFFTAATKEAARASRGAPAPVAIIRCVEAAARRNFDEGMAFERASFMQLVETPESRALRSLFFAERAAAKVAGLPKDATARDVNLVGVVGAGTMGTGIAVAFAAAGFEVRIVDSSADALARNETRSGEFLSSFAKRGRLSPEEAKAAASRMTRSQDVAALAQADLVIEAVIEDMATKRAVFRELDSLLRPGAIMASNTSFLNIDALAASTGRPGDVLGLHFFSPAHVMRLLEIVRGQATAPDVLLTAIAVARRIGKLPVVAGVCDGFIGNRMVDRYFSRALDLVAAGASPRQVDEAMTRFGFAMGPFAISDLAGNDIAWHVRLRKVAENPSYRYPSFADAMCERGWFGQKSGRGWFDYKPGDRTPHDNADLTELLREWRAAQGIVLRDVSQEEIVERCVFTLINEGARILEDGVAQRASDIDVVYVNGYGFPALRGGPMFHAAEIGLQNVCARLDNFAAAEPDKDWAPAALLRDAAREGGFDAAARRPA